jgi:hypothetical protein
MMPMLPAKCPHCGGDLLNQAHGAPASGGPGHPVDFSLAAPGAARPFAAPMFGCPGGGVAVTPEGMAALAYHAVEQARLDALRRFGVLPATEPPSQTAADAALTRAAARRSRFRVVRDDDGGERG